LASTGDVWWRGWAPPQKEIIFCPQNDGWVHFAAVFNRQKKESLETLILQFNGEITKLTKTVQNYPKLHGETKGTAVALPPEYATVHSYGSTTVLLCLTNT